MYNIIIGSNGSINGIAPGKYTGYSRSVIRRRVVISRPSYCTVRGWACPGVSVCNWSTDTSFMWVCCILYVCSGYCSFQKKFSSAGGINNVPRNVYDLPVQSVHVISFHYKAHAHWISYTMSWTVFLRARCSRSLTNHYTQSLHACRTVGLGNIRWHFNLYNEVKCIIIENDSEVWSTSLITH